MRGRRWGGWRWAVAGVLIGVLVLVFGVVLRHAQLGGAANAAQIVSLAPLLVGLMGWARRRPKAQDPAYDRPIGLGEMLRTIADAQGLTGEDLRARLKGWSGDAVDAYMDGTELPGWDFVAAFLDVVAGDDRWRCEALERQVRPVWKAAAGSRPLGGGAGAVVTEQRVVVMDGTRRSSVRDTVPRIAPLWALSVLVLLTVAGGVAYAMLGRGGDAVPQVKGMSLAQAEKMIRKAGLSYAVQQQPSSVLAQGSVLMTNPPNGTAVPADAKVTLTVSSGPQKVTVPKVQGMNAAQAIRKLTSLGLQVRQVQAPSSTQPLHTVVSQNPAPDTQAARDSEVTISISLGASRVPNVMNEDVNLARGHLANAGFTNATIVYLADPNLQNGIVISQNPPSGRVVLPSTQITLSVVKNQPVASPIPIFTAPTASPTSSPTPAGGGGNGAGGNGGGGNGGGGN